MGAVKKSTGYIYGTSGTIALPSVDATDGILVFLGYDNNGTISYTIDTSGYTKITAQNTANRSIAAFYKQNAAGTETTISLSGLNGTYAHPWVAFVIPGAHTTSMISTTVTGNGAASNQPTGTTYTTGHADVVSFCALNIDGQRWSNWDQAVQHVADVEGFTTSASAANRLQVGYQCYPSAGTTTAPRAYINASANWGMLQVPVRMASNQMLPGPGLSSHPVDIIQPLMAGSASFSGAYGGSHDTGIASDFTDIDGHTSIHDETTFSTVTGRSVRGYNWATWLRVSGGGEALGVAGINVTQTDYSGERLMFNMNLATYAAFASYPAGSCYFGIRTDNTGTLGWRVWRLPTATATPDPNGWVTIVIDVDNTDYVTEVGTYDSTKVDGFMLGVRRETQDTQLYFTMIGTMNTMKMGYGSSGNKLTFDDFVDQSSTYEYASFQRLAAGQYEHSHDWETRAGAYISQDNFSLLSVQENDEQAFVVGYRSDTLPSGKLYIDTYCSLTNGTFGGATQAPLEIEVSGSPTVDLGGTVISNKDLTLTGIRSGDLDGVIVRNCTQYTLAAVTGVLNGSTWDNSADATGSIVIDFASIADLNTAWARVNSSSTAAFINNAVGILLNYTGAANLTGTTNQLPDGMTAAGNTVDMRIADGGFDVDLTIPVPTGSGWSTDDSTGGGTSSITFEAPTFDLDVNVNVAATVRVFTAGTQTQLAVGTSTMAFSWTHGNQTVDITVWAAGYQQQQFTSRDLTNANVTIDVELVDVPSYNASHGLSYTSDLTYNRSTKELDPVTRQVGADINSALIDAFDAESGLHNTPYPIRMDGATTAIFLDDAYIKVASLDNWKRAGYEYRNTSDVVQKQAASFVSSGGTWSGATAEYQTTAGTGQTDARATGVIDEVVVIYTNGGDDLRSHWVWKYQVNGYREARSDIVDQFGTLEPVEYVFNMAEEAISAATGDPGIAAPTFTDHGASPVTWNGKAFSYTLQSNASGEDLIRELNYFLSLDADWEGESPFNRHEMILEAGSAYETQRGVHEGGPGAALKGVRVLNGSGDAHPDFTRFQADDGTYFTPAVVASISGSGMLTDGADIRLQISNETAAVADAWAATTAYSQGDQRLRSTGVGTESNRGLYFVATTAGTSGGTEPTWDTTVGNTTADGSVTWTCYSVIYYDDDPASTSFSDTYTNGEEFSAGDNVRIRWAEINGSTSAKKWAGTAVAATTGFSFVVSADTDAIYAANAVDGSALTKFGNDITGSTIRLIADSDFTLAEAYAYFCYTLTLSGGMALFWGGVTAIDQASYRIEDTILDLKFDETIGAFVKQQESDDARVYRASGGRPAMDPTTGGYGIEVNWHNPAYLVTTGSGPLTTAQAAELSTSATQSAAANTQVQKLDFDGDNHVSVNVQKMNDATLYGDGTEGDKWRGTA